MPKLRVFCARHAGDVADSQNQIKDAAIVQRHFGNLSFRNRLPGRAADRVQERRFRRNVHDGFDRTRLQCDIHRSSGCRVYFDIIDDRLFKARRFHSDGITDWLQRKRGKGTFRRGRQLDRLIRAHVRHGDYRARNDRASCIGNRAANAASIRLRESQSAPENRDQKNDDDTP